jgi:hypothetical protein
MTLGSLAESMPDVVALKIILDKTGAPVAVSYTTAIVLSAAYLGMDLSLDFSSTFLNKIEERKQIEEKIKTIQVNVNDPHINADQSAAIVATTATEKTETDGLLSNSQHKNKPAITGNVFSYSLLTLNFIFYMAMGSLVLTLIPPIFSKETNNALENYAWAGNASLVLLSSFIFGFFIAWGENQIVAKATHEAFSGCTKKNKANKENKEIKEKKIQNDQTAHCTSGLGRIITKLGFCFSKPANDIKPSTNSVDNPFLPELQKSPQIV